MKTKRELRRIFPLLLGILAVSMLFLGLFLYFRRAIFGIVFILLFLSAVAYTVFVVAIPLLLAERSIQQYIRGQINFDILRQRVIHTFIADLLEKISEDINRGYAADILKKQAEINYLQRQINPHFLYNCLESIRGNALVVEAEGIAEMTEALATFFRYSISQKGSMVTLEEELDNVNNYFIIQQYRFNNRFHVDYEYDRDIDLSQYYLLKLTIQPIVENALFHGLETKTGPGNVNIRITLTDRRLIINITDNGVGISEDRLAEIHRRLAEGMAEEDSGAKGGIALTNVNKRIKLSFGETYGVYITSIVDYGTDVELVLPMIHHKDVKKYKIAEF